MINLEPEQPENKDAPPEVKEKAHKLWHKPFIIILVVLAVLLAGSIIYYFWASSTISRQNNKIATMETLIDSKNSEIESLQGKINANEYVIQMLKAATTEAYFISATVGLSGSIAGGDASPNVISFGEVAPGSETSRTITLTEPFNTDTVISLNVLGSVSSFITLEPGDSLELKAGESQDVTLKLNLPATALPGTELTGSLFLVYAPGCHI
ncbi:MAG: hypothetical protein JW967_09025 [Dehalococcoidales bacterium]|nr:hypothetical protein [Dehalococcoidales bacterium]